MANNENYGDAFMGLFAEIARRDFFAKTDFVLENSSEIEYVATKFVGKIVVFFGISFEQVRHARLLMDHSDLEPVLIYSVNDPVGGHYAKGFSTSICVKDSGRSLFEVILALNPIAVTTTFPSHPLFYRLALPLLTEIKGIRSVPFAYEVNPPSEVVLTLECLRLHRFALASSSAAYSWHRPESRFANMTWIEPTCVFNVDNSTRRRQNSLVYAGSLIPGTPESGALEVIQRASVSGMYVALFDAKASSSRQLVSENDGVEVRPRLPEFELLNTLSEFEFGLLAPYIANETLPPLGSELEWLNRNGIPGKLSLYLEAGVIPLAPVRSVYVVEFIERYGIGLVLDDDRFLNLAEFLASVDTAKIRENIDHFRLDKNRQMQTANLIENVFRPRSL